MWPSLLFPLEVKLLAWSPLCLFALLSQLSSISIHHISRMLFFARAGEESPPLGQQLTTQLVWEPWEEVSCWLSSAFTQLQVEMTPFGTESTCNCVLPCSQTTSEAPFCSLTCQPWFFLIVFGFPYPSCLSLLWFIPVTVTSFPFSILSILHFCF